jgi:hypothetical protein
MKNDVLEQVGPLQPGEIKQLVFDFAVNELEDDESLAEVIGVTVSAYFGDDPQAASMLSGDASIVGDTVVQRVTMRRAGVTYLVRCTVRGSSGLRHTLSAFLPCVTAA